MRSLTRWWRFGCPVLILAANTKCFFSRRLAVICHTSPYCAGSLCKSPTRRSVCSHRSVLSHSYSSLATSTAYRDEFTNVFKGDIEHNLLKTSLHTTTYHVVDACPVDLKVSHDAWIIANPTAVSGDIRIGYKMFTV
jgi:hypothetical protein